MKNLLLVLSLCLLHFFSYGQEKPILLYPEGVPNSKPIPKDYIEGVANSSWITKVSVPTLTPFYPDKANSSGTAVIVFPGGGYAGLSSVTEGAEICKEFNKIGITAFLLKYRLPNDQIMIDKTIGPLQDAQMAILTVRANAKSFGIDEKKIGVIGFSAGGHLAGMSGTQFDKALIKNNANISLRPDFMMLIYPVVSFGEMTHLGSRENLIGQNFSNEQIKRFSNEQNVNSMTPPTFLIHSQDDTVVPVQNALLLYNELIKKGVKGEMHIFENGGHGFGLHNPKSSNQWFDWATNWLKENGFGNMTSPEK